jgi:hypothetical protein
MSNYNALIDVAEEWLDSNAQAEFEAWLDKQKPSRPEPQDCDPNYVDDFPDPILIAIGTFDLPISA